MTTNRILFFAFALLMVSVSGARAQAWNETGDAGDLVPSAQSTVGTGALTQINGALASPTDVDLYCIRMPAVPPAGSPLIQLQCVVNQGPNVWMFDAAGNGVFVNETCQFGSKRILAPSVSLAAGTYYVAVSYYGYDAQSAGGTIWLSGTPGQRAPDGPGAAGTLIGWAGSPVVQQLNPYTIYLSAMTFCEAPVPTRGLSWGGLKVTYR